MADLNGDGKSDLVWYNASTSQTAVWLMNGLAAIEQTVIRADPNWQVTHTADFNGDGKADALWYNAATGQTAIWQMNGTASLSQSLIFTDPNWKVLLTADFNGDGKADLLWYNNSTGQTAVWLMNGATATAKALLLTDTLWYVVAAPDLDGDGKADLLWYNSTTGQTVTWLMNGIAPVSKAYLLTHPNWRVTHTADLDGDGKADLIWYDASTGQTAVWLMNGATATQASLIFTDPDWKVTATPDLNGDGKADLIWHNTSTGQTAAWLMNGTTSLAHTLLLTDYAWNVVQTRDLNGDGKSDLVWFNPGTGQTAAWLMNGTSLSSGSVLFAHPDWRQTTQGDTAGYSNRFFNYTDRFNYSIRYYQSSNIPDATGLYTYYDLRVGQASGAAVPTATLYDTSLYATPTGWNSFNGSVANTNRAGAAGPSSYGWGYQYSNTRVDYDVSGWPMSSVVALTQDTSGNSVATMQGVNAGALVGTLPAGSRLQKIVSTSTATPVGYRVSDGNVNVSTLAAMVAAYPVPASPTAANTVSTGNLHGDCPSICLQERTRVAFGGGNSTTYYLCDYNGSTNSSYNCQLTGTGTFTLGTAVDGVTPIMTFNNLPSVASVQSYYRVFVQRNSTVYYGYQDKLATTLTYRLNYIGFRAVAAQLGVTAP